LHPSEQSLLEALATVRAATVAQLTRAHVTEHQAPDPETAGRTVRKNLVRLMAFGLVRRFINTARDRKIGPAGYVYVLTNVGARLAGRLEALGQRQRKIWHPSQAAIDHWLSITDLYADLRAEAADGNLTIREFQVEGDAKRIYRDSYGAEHLLRPDALVRLTSGDMQLSWFVEMDRATESPRRIADKCRRYRAYELTDLEYRQHGVFPGVVFIVPDEARARVIRRVITTQPSEARGLFWVTTKADAIKALTHPNPT